MIQNVLFMVHITLRNVVVKIFGHERKPGKDGQIGVVQPVHMYVEYVDRRVGGRKIPHCKAFSSLVYKRREGPLV